ncbi:hypothetical protein Franean1_6703 [Parafrankia sp. EAN1pec]|uniref:hypothetical protein n=1 Tax=Parafrankia sp. (strain EAN1pec) TaxID=298653 RepID=UPI0000543160|nr:hypothetical protein Franean1_6703 [Frankia sp. EAN1pec]
MTGRAAAGRAGRVPLLAASALVAAGLGWALLFRDRPFETTLAVVLGSAAVGTLLAALLGQPLTDRARPPEPDRPSFGPGTGGTQPQTAQPETAQQQTGQPETAQLVLPVGRPAGGAPPAGQWWTRDAPPAAAPAAATVPARPAPRDLGELRDSARVVQCPRCGAFRLDVQQTGAGYAFRCRVDGHEWAWRPGTAWPVAVVASRRRSTR